jgi:hypothetical protein
MTGRPEVRDDAATPHLLDRRLHRVVLEGDVSCPSVGVPRRGDDDGEG